ncbi:MAG: N-acetylneuraminate synthase family protein [Verrucomicrobiae bacterium]|nr:N-acetylneuraminate synthase family protein [Verrucomicrobiae bacterium]
MSVHIIAEAGSNYNGSVELARQLNAVASDAKADSVKYQIIYPEGLYRPGEYAYGHYDIKEVWRIRESGVLDDDSWRAIAADALERGILFSASIFDTRGLDLLCGLDPPYLKIASCDLNNLRFLREVAARGLPMVVSTGMSTLGDIEKAVAALAAEGIGGEKLVLLHCVSAYPAPLGSTNLAFLGTLRAAFGTAIGFSDHTTSHEAACAAVALGATWIEKHFTTDKTLEGFDHKHAQEPGELAAYVAAIRETEQSITPKVAKIGDAEAYTRQRARRGVYAARELPAGHVLTSADLAIVRPESPIAADRFDELVGMKLKAPLAAFAPLTWEGLEHSDA